MTPVQIYGSIKQSEQRTSDYGLNITENKRFQGCRFGLGLTFFGHSAQRNLRQKRLLSALTKGLTSIAVALASVLLGGNECMIHKSFVTLHENAVR